MFKIEKLGNKELAVSRLAVQLRVRHAILQISDDDFANDIRSTLDRHYLSECKLFLRENKKLYLKMFNEATKSLFDNISAFTKSIINNLNDDDKIDIILYNLLVREITRRGFNVEDNNWIGKMESRPTYIREIYETNFPGEHDISTVDVFDYPVRKACKILNEKGYITYWSSANCADFDNNASIRWPEIPTHIVRGKGSVIKDKRVAYILIDPYNLTDKLKQQLLLNGRCDFWGIALNHADNGKYYGIWAEITSLDMKCDDLSDILVKKALALPELKKVETHPSKR